MHSEQLFKGHILQVESEQPSFMKINHHNRN